MATTLAIFSDIHGNLAALQAVHRDMQQRGITRSVCLGDLVAMGPEPAACLRYLAETIRPEHVIRGNTDRYVSELLFERGDTGKDPEFLRIFAWTHAQLDGAARRYLAGLPAERLVTVDDVPILLVHGAPRDDELGLTTEMPLDQTSRWLRSEGAQVLVGGHTHLPMVLETEDGWVINDGAVGYPFDGDQRACYLALTVDLGRVRSARFHRVAYDVEQTVSGLTQRGVPWSAELTRRLRTANS